MVISVGIFNEVNIYYSQYSARMNILLTALSVFKILFTIIGIPNDAIV